MQPDAPACAPGSMPAEAAFDAALKWAESLPLVERRRSFSECLYCAAADVSLSCVVLSDVLECMGYHV